MATVVSSLAVEIGAEIAGLQRGLTQADKQIGSFVDRARQQTMALGAAMTAGVTLPLVGLAAAAAKTAISWESAFAGVRKTVNATEQEFDSLARGLRDMATGATGSPVAGLENAAVTLAGVAAAAGQLGIAKEHLLEFTETMAMLGMATNLTAEEAAFSLAQFANITQMPVENIDRLGATIVALGNNSATTERDIVEFAQRLAGAGKGAGLTESNILALSAAMASVGLNAEAGGTAMTMVMNAITKAVAGGGAELEDFAALSGWSAGEFAQWWRGEPISALEAFIGGLSQLDNEQQVLMLDQLGLDGIRVSDTLRRMAGNTDVLTRSITIANEAWGENNALVNEAEQRFMTTEAQLNLLGNNLKDVGITIGSILLPPINNLIAGIVPLLRWVGQLDPAIVQVGLAFVAAAAAAGPLLIVVGALLSPVGLVAGGIAAAAVAIAAFKDEILNALPWLDDLLEGAGRLFDMFGAGDAQQAADGAARAVQSVPKIFDIEIPAGQTVWDAWAASYKDQFPDWQEFRGLAEEALSAQGLTFTTIPGGGLSIQFPMGTEIVSVGRPGRQMLPFDEASDTIAGMNFGDKLRAAFGGTELSGIVDEIVVQFERLGGIGTAIQAAWDATEGLSFGARIVAVFNPEDVSAAIDSFIAPLRSIPEKLGAALSGVFGGGTASPADMLAEVNSELAAPQGGGFDLSGVQAWAEAHFSEIVTTVATVASIVFGGPVAMAIGAAKLLASAIENDFLGIGTYLNESGISAAVEGAFNSILASIRGIFGGGGASPADMLAAVNSEAVAPTGGGGGLLDGLFAGLLNFTPPDLSPIVAAVEGVLAPLRTSIEGAWASIEPHVRPFIDGIKGFFEALQDTDTKGLDNIAATIGTIATSIFAGLSSVIGTLLDLGGSAIGGILKGLGDALPKMGEGISAIVSAFSIAAETGDVGAALDSLGLGVGKFGDALLGFGKGAADGLLEAIGKLIGVEMPTVDGALSTFGAALQTAWYALELIVDKIRRAVEAFVLDIQVRVLGFIADFRQRILDATGGQVDISPNITMDLVNLHMQLDNRTLADALVATLQAQMSSGAIDLGEQVVVDLSASQFLGTADMLLQDPSVLLSMSDVQREALKTQLQGFLTSTLETGVDPANSEFQALVPLATTLGVDVPSLIEQQQVFFTQMATEGQFAVIAPVTVTMDVRIANPDAVANAIAAAQTAGVTSTYVQSGGLGVPGFASGISYVPNTMLAMLHGGERVLTREENRAYSQGSGVGGTFVINAYGGSPHELARMVQRAIREGDR